jgi:DNA-binding CsgD family transcriptional regulator
MYVRLIGRDVECSAIDELVAEAREGASRALVLCGEPGIGKTVLLDYAAERADGFTLARSSGVSSEMQLGYAALHRVLSPYLERMTELPVPQRDALGAAFGLNVTSPPDRFLVGLASLTLLTDAAHREPLMLLLDDVQWLDDDSLAALAFVARRIDKDRIALVAAERTPADAAPIFEGIASLGIEGLDDVAARELLGSSLQRPVSPRLADAVIVEASGNPLALVELGSEVSSRGMSEELPPPDPLPMSGRLESRFMEQVRTLPEDTQTMLLLASADPEGQPDVLRRAADWSGLSMDAIEPAEAAGLVVIERRVVFRHPLIRSAVYTSATTSARHRAHEALAAVTSGSATPDVWVSHLALATRGPDETVARELESAADRTAQRGGYAGEVAMMVRSADLTPDVTRRAQRMLRAASAAAAAAEFAYAHSLLEKAQPDLSAPIDVATALALEGTLAGPLGNNRRAPVVLLQAARRMEPLNHEGAGDLLLGAINAVYQTYPEDDGATASAIATAGLDTVRDSTPEGTTTDRLLDAFSQLIRFGFADALVALRRAGDHLQRAAVSREELMRYFSLATFLSHALWDEELYLVAIRRLERAAREQGALFGLTSAISGFASYEVRAGRFDAARLRYAEYLDLSRAAGFPMDVELLDVELFAWRGDDETARQRVRALVEFAEDLGSAPLDCHAHLALMILELGEGNYAAALSCGQRVESADNPAWTVQAVPGVIEAAHRCGQIDVANAALERLAERVTNIQTPWALGIAARCRAVLAPADRAEPLYVEAIDQLQRSDWRTELARAHLLYGEWLRRQKRRIDAREQLRLAHEMFLAIGAMAFAERARLELLATGERARARRVDTQTGLTPRESQVAALAAQRVTSREIAAQLFISSNTVEYHLRKVFQKLGITSRRDLAARLADLDETSKLDVSSS